MADVSVEIPGIGQVNAVNAATESTLQEILKAMKKGGGLGGGGAGAGGGAGGAAGKAGKELGKFEKEVAESTTALDDMGKAAVYAANDAKSSIRWHRRGNWRHYIIW